MKRTYILRMIAAAALTGALLPAVVSAGSPPPPDATWFVPIQPCRIFDTRVFPGPFGAWSAGETRDVLAFDFLEGDIEDQGGKVGGCGIPFNATAIHLNFTAVDPAAFGYMRAWPIPEDEPIATLLNYHGATNISNATALRICTPPNVCRAEFQVKVYESGTDLVGDVTGFYIPVCTGGPRLGF